MRGIWDWAVCSVIRNVRAALCTAGCGPKSEFSRRSERMARLHDQGNEGNLVFGPYDFRIFVKLLSITSTV